MTLCKECSNRNTCKNICNLVKKEIAGRGKTAERKPKTYPIDFLHIEDTHQSLNDFQKDVLRTISGISATLENNLIERFDLNEAIRVGLNENEKHIIELFIENYKQDEIAKRLGISQPRVHFLFQRALQKLKKILS